MVRTILFASLIALLAGCTYYQVAPSGGASVFDRSWSAALAAAADTGVAVYSSDRASGTIRGTRGPDDVTMNVFTQADGSVRVEINVKPGGYGSDPGLAQRLSDAYDRHMGR